MTGSASAPPLPRRVAVLGGGLVGGSVALAAREAGVDEVAVHDGDPAVRRRAGELGIGTEVTDDLRSAVAGADLVVVATPSATVPTLAAEAAPAMAPGAVLTDVASLKGELTAQVEDRLRSGPVDPSRYVGGHPMAGSERSGPDAADAALFQGATWVLTPTAVTDDATLRTVSGFLRRLGARVLVLPPHRHDELVALVSHLPQLVASTLADVAGRAVETAGDAVLAVAGGGFRDTTRIAASDPELWLGILEGNRGAVLDAVSTYLDELHRLRDALAAEDWSHVRGLLEHASASRRRLVPKQDERLAADLVVALDDRPGALAVVATALGEAGVNIEDLAMRHATDARGALLVRVDRDDAARGLEAVRGQGLHAHVEEVDPGAEPLTGDGDASRGPGPAGGSGSARGPGGPA
jgi:prephenate dehydrogenase